MNLQTDIFGRYYSLTDNFTDGLNSSVFYSACHNYRQIYRRIFSVGIPNTHRQIYQRYNSIGMSHYHRRDKSIGIFQAGNFFFCAQFPSVKPSANVFFIFLTDIATDYGITDKKKADGCIPSVNKLPTKS
jgi:hypothetical protein